MELNALHSKAQIQNSPAPNANCGEAEKPRIRCPTPKINEVNYDGLESGTCELYSMLAEYNRENRNFPYYTHTATILCNFLAPSMRILSSTSCIKQNQTLALCCFKFQLCRVPTVDS